MLQTKANQTENYTQNKLPSYIPSTMMTQHPDNAISIEKDKGVIKSKLERIETLMAVLLKEKWDIYSKGELDGEINGKKVRIAEHIQEALQEYNIYLNGSETLSKKKEEQVKIPLDLGIEEVMIDYEGKMTGYIDMELIVSELVKCECFPGIDVFITPRIPASGKDKEPTYRQIITLTSIFAANNAAHEIYKSYSKTRRSKNFPQAIFEMILPMCSSVEEMVKIHERLEKIYDSLDKDYKQGSVLENFRIIPLVEGITELMMIDRILKGYIEYLISKWGIEKVMERPIRVMLGRSDPAIFFGMVPSVLAIKLALSECAKIEEEYEGNIQIAPILGVGSLPFRGHLTPGNFENIFKEYSGIRTVTIQSALRYDHTDGGRNPSKLIEEIKKIKTYIHKYPLMKFNDEEKAEIKNLITEFTIDYWKEFGEYYMKVKPIFGVVPKRRDRMVPTGEYRRYGRGLPEMQHFFNFITERDKVKGIEEAFGKIKKIGDELEKNDEKFPRAITFTAGFYSFGIPPELLGTLSRLSKWKNKKKDKKNNYDKELRRLEKYYKNIKEDLKAALRYALREDDQKFGKLIEDARNKFDAESMPSDYRRNIERIQDCFREYIKNIEALEKNKEKRGRINNSREKIKIEEKIKEIENKIKDFVENIKDEDIITTTMEKKITNMGKIRKSLG